MYIAPNTDVKLLHQIPFTPSYNDTIWFADTTSQLSYFNTKVKYTLSAQSYQRVDRGYIRVNYCADDLYDCNYMMFKNSSFGNKWFYAFILNVEYINNVVAQINYEIDVIQSWLFDFHLEQCFVEREHSYTDYIGDNLVPEKFELGEYVYESLGSEGWLNTNLRIVVASAIDLNLDNAEGNMYGGVYSGIQYLAFNNASQVNAYLADLVDPTTGDKHDAVVSMFMFPAAFISNIAAEEPQAPIEKQVNFPKSITYIGAYTPRNKKLLTSPYNTFMVTTSEGNYAEFPYEYFSDAGLVTFSVMGALASNPEFWLVPRAYKDVGKNYIEKLTFSSLPQCAYNIDTFRAWVAQHKYPLIAAYWGGALNTVSGIASVGIDVAGYGNLMPSMNSPQTKRGVGRIKSGIAAATGAVMAVKQASLMPAHSIGQTTNVLGTAWGELGFHYYRAHIREEFAKIIDDFFDMYGYATNRVKIPNIHARSEWTYTKTIGCELRGGLPSDDAEKICDIFDSGIRFWTNGNHLGDYSYANNPFGGGD